MNKVITLIMLLGTVFSADILHMYDATSVSGKTYTIKDNEIVFRDEKNVYQKKSLLDEVSSIEIVDKYAKKIEFKKQPVTAILANGDRVGGELVEYNGSALTLKTPFGETTLVSNTLLGLIFIDDGAPFAVDRNFTTITLKNGDELKCRLKEIKDGKIKVGSDLGDLELSFDRVKKIVMQASRSLDMKGKDFIAVLDLVNGDRYSGRGFSFAAGKFKVEPFWALKAKQAVYEFDYFMVSSISFLNTGVVYLSDLKPKSVKETPFFDFHLPYKNDKNLKGTAIRINSNEYRKGITCQAKTEFVYDLGGNYGLFRCFASIEDSAVTGSANLIISADGKTAYEKKLVKGADAEKIEISLKGVLELSILVDYGDAKDAGAFAAFGNPMLVKIKEGKEEAVKIAEGVFRVGLVLIDKNKKEVSFPAKIESKEALIEYIAVNDEGKSYESVLVTETRPIHLQVGLILLGLEYGQNITVRNDSAEPKGSKVDIFLELDGKRMTMQEVIFDRVKKTGLTDGDFVFTGSRIVAGSFLAEQEASLISTSKDPGAVIVYNKPTEPDTTGYSAYDSFGKNLPEVGSKVTVIIKAK